MKCLPGSSKNLAEGLHLVRILADKKLVLAPETPTFHMLEAACRADRISRKRIMTIYKAMISAL